MSSYPSGEETPILPVTAQPQGLAYFLGTWSGRLIVLNSAVFIWLCWQSGSVFLPDTHVLIDLGARDPVVLAQGKIWYFLTPIFVHIGVIHFAFNTMGLFYIGYQLERVLGSFWFLLIYLFSGVFGNVMSSLVTLGTSAGASGSLFGLLGAGFYFERLIGRKMEAQTGRRPRNQVYSGMVVLNVVLGLLIPVIDNGAHLGGLAAGFILSSVMLDLRANRLRPSDKIRGLVFLTALMTATLVGGWYATRPDITTARLLSEAQKSESAAESYQLLSKVIALDSTEPHARLRRGRLLLFAHHREEALDDLSLAAIRPEVAHEYDLLVRELREAGQEEDARTLEELVPESSSQAI